MYRLIAFLTVRAEPTDKSLWDTKWEAGTDKAVPDTKNAVLAIYRNDKQEFYAHISNGVSSIGQASGSCTMIPVLTHLFISTFIGNTGKCDGVTIVPHGPGPNPPGKPP